MRRLFAALLVLFLPLLVWADGSSGSGSNATSQLVSGVFQGCWACGAFNTIGAIGLGLADSVFSQLASGMTILIGLFMALWILFFAAKLFLPFGSPGSSHWNMGAAKLLKLIFVLAFLQTSGPFWDYIFTPIMSAGLGLASVLATSTDIYETTFATSGDIPNGGFDYCKSPAPDTGVPNLSDTVKQGVTALEQMDCPLSRIQSQFGKGIMIGVATIGEMGCQDQTLLSNLIPTKAAIARLTAGVILIGVFLFGFLMFPFLLIDVLARVILVAAMSPLAIAAILFKPTARIAERAVWSLLQAGITLMFGAAIAGIGKALLAYILQKMSKNGAQLTDWSSFQSTLENSCSAGFNVDFGTASFYMLVGTAIITIFMMRRASSLAADLTGIAGGTGAQAGFAALAGAAGSAVGQGAKLVFQEQMRRDREKKSNKAAQVTANDE